MKLNFTQQWWKLFHHTKRRAQRECASYPDLIWLQSTNYISSLWMVSMINPGKLPWGQTIRQLSKPVGWSLTSLLTRQPGLKDGKTISCFSEKRLFLPKQKLFKAYTYMCCLVFCLLDTSWNNLKNTIREIASTRFVCRQTCSAFS